MKIGCILIISSIFFFFGCPTSDDADLCEDALADLTAEVAIGEGVTIIQGESFEVPNAITNNPELAACLGEVPNTQTAGPSDSNLQIDFDLHQDGSYAQNETDVTFAVSMPIPSGSTVTELFTTQFNAPGNYRVITTCDALLKVPERNENNNVSAEKTVPTGRLGSPDDDGKIREALIITVLPSLDFKKKKGQENVEILSRRVHLD